MLEGSLQSVNRNDAQKYVSVCMNACVRLLIAPEKVSIKGLCRCCRPIPFPKMTILHNDKRKRILLRCSHLYNKS